MLGCWTEDMIWISLLILMRSASVSILLFLIVLIATYKNKSNVFISPFDVWLRLQIILKGFPQCRVLKASQANANFQLKYFTRSTVSMSTDHFSSNIFFLYQAVLCERNSFKSVVVKTLHFLITCWPVSLLIPSWTFP